MGPYTGAVVTKALGISQKLLTQWVDRKLIVPARQGRGHGSKTEYGLEDIIKIALFNELAKAGISRFQASAIVFPEAPSSGSLMLEAAISQLLTPIPTLLGGTMKHDPYMMFFFQEADGSIHGFNAANRVEWNSVYSKIGSLRLLTVVNLTAIVEQVVSQVV